MGRSCSGHWTAVLVLAIEVGVAASASAELGAAVVAMSQGWAGALGEAEAEAEAEVEDATWVLRRRSLVSLAVCSAAAAHCTASQAAEADKAVLAAGEDDLGGWEESHRSDEGEGCLRGSVVFVFFVAHVLSLLVPCYRRGSL